MKTQGFPKREHLCLKKDIENLFSAGSRAITIYPLRAVYRTVSRTAGAPQAQVLVSVAKRRLHHAVDRNRAKRQLREAYRLNKQLLSGLLPEEKMLHIGFIWLSERPVRTETVSERMTLILHRLAEILAPETPVADATEPQDSSAI